MADVPGVSEPTLNQPIVISSVFRRFADLCDDKELQSKMAEKSPLFDPGDAKLLAVINAMRWYAMNIFEEPL